MSSDKNDHEKTPMQTLIDVFNKLVVNENDDNKFINYIYNMADKLLEDEEYMIRDRIDEFYIDLLHNGELKDSVNEKN